MTSVESGASIPVVAGGIAETTVTATDLDMVVVEEERTDCFRLILILISEFSSISRVLVMTQARKHSPMSVLPNLELKARTA